MFKSAEISYLYKHSKKKNTTCNRDTYMNSQWNMPISNHCRGRKAHLKYQPTYGDIFSLFRPPVPKVGSGGLQMSLRGSRAKRGIL